MSSVDSLRFVAVAHTADVPLGRTKLCVAVGQEIIVCNVDGHYYAIENRCSHLGKPLTGGRLMGAEITCPFHSATFDVRTGAANGFPASRPIKSFTTRLNGAVIEVAI